MESPPPEPQEKLTEEQQPAGTQDDQDAGLAALLGAYGSDSSDEREEEIGIAGTILPAKPKPTLPSAADLLHS